MLSMCPSLQKQVHERVAPSVERETVKPMQREERTVATDREVHQDHYHTTVQPVQHSETLPEQHHHNIIPVEHRTHDHRNKQETESHLQREAAQFKDESVRHDMKHSTGAAPSVAGEHVHHHVHETIQPVVQKETIEPHVMHTTVPVHETHHNVAQHHAASALPAVSMADFKKQGGMLSGREERTDHFTGEPRSLEHALGHHGGMGHGAGATGSRNTAEQDIGMRGQQGSGLAGGVGSGTTQHQGASSHLHGANTTTGVGNTGTGSHLHGNNTSTGVGNTGTGSHLQGNQSATGAAIGTGVGGNKLSNTSSSGTETTRKPSLMDKLNPRKDADGDGKKGFMD